MNSRWESSQKPLFVKTVWMGSHRHAVLCKNELRPDGGKTKWCETSRSSSGLPHKCKIPRINERTCEILKISPVKIFLTEMKKLKNDSPRFASYETLPTTSTPKTFSVEIVPSSCVKYKNLNADVMIANRSKADRNQNNQFSKKRMSRLSSSFDLEYEKDMTRHAYETFYKTNQFLKEQVLQTGANALSDRVLIWLDLATQNQQTDQEVTKVQQRQSAQKPRVNTAHFYKNVEKGRMWINEQAKVQYRTRIPVSCEEDEFFSSEEDSDPRVEFDSTEKSVEENCQLQDLSRRELHIFLPEIPKRVEECDSLISSSYKSGSVENVE